MTTRIIDDDELQIYGVEPSPHPDKRRWFHANEIFTIKDIVRNTSVPLKLGRY